MSRESEAVKTWRQETKKRIVAAMGGKCCVCSYNKCNESLALHHLNPEDKELSFGRVMSNPKAWEKIVPELRKCILVCHNCHGEIHNNITTVPLSYPKFDESFVQYKRFLPKTHPKEERVKIFDKCPICNGDKPITQITCSLKCAAKRSYVVNWDSVNLSSLLKIKSVVQIADELGCSDGAVHKRLKKLGLK